ncbi:putative atp-dependent rna helicase dhx8 protein [Phaeoacremonium minimum UCRPA7]|uniref:Putative atp-dependent rna helicase dhx8 protein n=1 Tax=Phaeoacremonium minimum (strain UCR-PA7) TaxID=1286976 RepID=R8BE86_PHAM7|nr:putative atp-dependent rna helicase dhx8 protein [Phaeoacremonium minimum UCRPA7]EON97607.1 putative atp-dependent rna helicase dhx8 protein [Phaeoacremonium minimum UCRPA7]
MPLYREIRAAYDSKTITVYQAYKAEIADPAVSEQKLHASPLFKPSRMTWIKPSWAWMLYRAGYSYKDRGQERILALHMKHEHFIELLEHGALAHKNADLPINTSMDAGESESLERLRKFAEAELEGGNSAQQIETDGKPQVRVQWDPERTIRLEKLPHRSIQIGIPAALSSKWTETMIVRIEDVTEKARELKKLLDERDDITNEELIRKGLIPVEKVFDVPEHVQRLLEMG